MRLNSVNMAERRSRRQAARWGMAAAWAAVGAPPCGDEPPWEIAPYRIHMTLAVDDTVRPEPGLQARLSQQLQQRVEASLRPWWVLTIEGAADPAARRMCFAPDLTTTDEPPLPLPPVDKMMWVGVSAAPVGYEIQVQEFDALTRRWAWPVHSTARQRSMLAESTFRAVVEAFAPLARIEPGETPADAQLIMKGGALPRPPGADLLTAPGDAFLPMVRRVRGGSSDSSLPVVPWTYLVAVDESPGIWRAVVDSALRQPLAARRRGLVEHLAIGLGRPREPAMVRFFARSNPDEPLAGYEVFRIPAEGENPVLAGRTGADGVFAVYPG
ncbi:MAG TPA: hypothetical protein PKC18_12580, partial [Lacipirellulaceae bacterium]|nr:hypothetical protein [Lacipirellulaceae bacterium]